MPEQDRVRDDLLLWSLFEVLRQAEETSEEDVYRKVEQRFQPVANERELVKGVPRWRRRLNEFSHDLHKLRWIWKIDGSWMLQNGSFDILSQAENWKYAEEHGELSEGTAHRRLLEAFQRSREWLQARLHGRAWMVRGSSVEGRDIVGDWIGGGWVSLAASKLGKFDPVAISAVELKQAVVDGYAHKSVSYQELRYTEFERFLFRINENDLVVTSSQGRIYFGEIVGAAYFVDSDDGRSNLRREVHWLNSDQPLRSADLRPAVHSLLRDQSYVVDLTEAHAELESLVERYSPEPSFDMAPLPELAFPEITDTLANDLLYDKAWLERVADRLWHRHQIVLYGPPGTGKTWLARHLAEHLTSSREHAVKLVQFHPSYSYEDFFQGFRPVNIDGTLSYQLTDGPFLKFAEDAADNRNVPYVLIIDEINRANLAKVFGELYFALEYRDAAINLQYSPDRQFRLPDNLFVIGTMNTADRSIALVDAAMRRRFAFLELHPRSAPIDQILRKWLQRKGMDSPAADLLDELNRRLADSGDSDHAIGPSYFMDSEIYRRPDGLELVWQTEIMPLLEELHYGEERSLVAERYDLPVLRAAVGEP